ncbi:KAP family P-loop NTPase fold protein [Verrucosispora sp. TAA-831]|uniref:KAP family P-loop NTPase fold protein n=1 Tax=Verrucosispora sp. TAA-831 TaxID=3422227 RepID=UPI003D6FB98E
MGIVKARDRAGYAIVTPVPVIRAFVDEHVKRQWLRPPTDPKPVDIPVVESANVTDVAPTSPVVGTRGFADAPAKKDLLGRAAMVNVLTEALDPTTADGALSGGPVVIGVEGPWGTGKTTTIRLVYQALTARDAAWSAQRRGNQSRWQRLIDRRQAWRLTPAGAHWLLKVWRRPEAAAASSPAEERGGPPVVAMFEPWAHQSSEQVWAGLVRVITHAAVSAMCPSRGAQRRYWLARNAQRLDITPLRRALWRGVSSPLLGLSLFALVAPIAIQFMRLNPNVTPLGVDAMIWAWAIPATLLAAGLGHTGARYLFGRAEAFIPEELFSGPVMSNVLAGGTSDAILRDPLHHARSGSLYLVQHDVKDVLDKLNRSGRELVIFVDDLDRCAPSAAVEVLQAINLFLSGSLGGARFVIGLDQTIVAAQLGQIYDHIKDSTAITFGDDPGPGWSFLRKLIQLPIPLRRLTAEHLDSYLAGLLGPVRSQPASSRPDDTNDAKPDTPGQFTRSDSPALTDPLTPDTSTTVQAVLDSHVLERDPEVRTALWQRLAAADVSGRETKRLLNVWQFNLRIALYAQPGLPYQAAVQLACRLVVASEILIRWPALLRQLSISVGGRPALTALAEVVDDDVEWGRIINRLKLDKREYHAATRRLRALLTDNDAKAIAALTAALL